MLRVPTSEIANRLVAFQALLAKNDIDAAIIRQNTDLYYFTGTVQDAHLVVPALGEPVFLVRRDIGRAGSESPIRPLAPLQSIKDLPGAVIDACGNHKPERIGMELDVLPANSFFLYDEKLFPNQRIVDVSGLIRQLRMIKSEWEIGMMRKAAEISLMVANAVPSTLREGMSELELSAELELVARKAGHLGMIRLRSFNMEMYFGHILSGAEAAIPAYPDAPTGGLGMSPSFGQGPSDRRIGAGEVVSVDTVVNYNGYLNDQTRNFSIGSPHEKLLDAYRLVQDIHLRFKEIAKPGAVTGELYNEVLRWVEKEGYGDFFMGCGDSRVSFVAHGIGLEVDELPFVAKGHKLGLEQGMTIAFEPKCIIPSLGIVGLENTYAVGEKGIESLNCAREDLIIL